ncbi:hypothetical protein NBH00_08000 [Paraconexibacter antarcticus]|uniref:Secreted protein n=1 Tax=Paraconexibacter antarcticus TaxID=2949664 RepID=A0ABY5DYW3_9ACTN|nr:hypothetical protein [Paraconexibacter antarcticus]UTI66134.1 hypothetical protein NBH00_08000 [Paraconexibacter antarcticus]
MTRLKSRLTYANVTASIALFVALGGSSYAALSLPRNSVGTNQIRTGAVGSSEIRNHSVALRDMSSGAQRALRGAIGPAGPAGPTGPPAARDFEVVSGAGALIRGTAVSGGRAGSPGTYTVAFAAPTTACAVTASLGSTDATVVPAGRVTTSVQGGMIGVQTYDAAGAPADLPFNLIVAC